MVTPLSGCAAGTARALSSALEPVEPDFDEPEDDTSKPAEDHTEYKKLGKEACGNLDLWGRICKRWNRCSGLRWGDNGKKGSCFCECKLSCGHLWIFCITRSYQGISASFFRKLCILVSCINSLTFFNTRKLY